MVASLRRATGWGGIAGLAVAIVAAILIALLPLKWAVLGLIGSVAVVATVVEPRLGLLLLVPAVPFGTLWQMRVGVMNVGVAEALLGLVLAAWLARAVARRGRETHRERLPSLAVPLGLFLAAMILSVLGTFSLQHSVKEIVKWTEVLVVYLLAALELRAGWARAAILVLLATGALAAVHGIVQFLFQLGPEEFILFGRFMRAYGTFEQPNPYGGYLGLTLPLALGLIVAAALTLGRWPRRWRWLTMAVAAGSGALMLAALIMSWSRGAWLGLGAAVAAIAVAVVVRSGRGAVLAVAAVALVAYIVLAGGLAQVPSSLIQRFADFVPYLGVLDVRGAEVTDANFAVLERVAHWQAAWQMWTDHPWLGVGIGNYEPIYPRYALPVWPFALGHAHNYYLNIAAEAGVVGLAAYLLLWGAALVTAWQAARRATGWAWGVALGVLGIVVHLSVHNLVDNLFVHGMYLQLALVLGLVSNTRWDSTAKGEIE